MSNYLKEGERLGMLALERFRRMTPMERRETYVQAGILDRDGKLTRTYGGTGKSIFGEDEIGILICEEEAARIDALERAQAAQAQPEPEEAKAPRKTPAKTKAPRAKTPQPSPKP
jgi:hypothetical protein